MASDREDLLLVAGQRCADFVADHVKHGLSHGAQSLSIDGHGGR